MLDKMVLTTASHDAHGKNTETQQQHVCNNNPQHRLKQTMTDHH